MNTNTCPGCSGELKADYDHINLQRCIGCGGLIGAVTPSQMSKIVKPEYHPDPKFPIENSRYFDLTILGSKLSRRHGWYDPATGYTVQEG
jgi:hypothetical protein